MIAEITPQERLGSMLNFLESEGYALWYDNETNEWSLLYTEEDDSENYNPIVKDKGYSVTGFDKEQVIRMAFSDLIF
jgi:glutamine synthetase